jgi:uncharacterized protein with von Willebrand factor type A (vWA) domain
MREKKRKNNFYYSSKKALEKSRMRLANKECETGGPSILLNFGNADVADIVGAIDGVLHAIQEVEEVMNININDVECATKETVSPAPP